MNTPTLTLCRTCVDADETLVDRLTDAAAAAGVAVRLQQVDCMSGCDRPQTLAVRQNGKTAYLFGEITGDDIGDIVTFLQLYTYQPDGNFADARPLGELRFKAIARIPADIS